MADCDKRNLDRSPRDATQPDANVGGEHGPCPATDGGAELSRTRLHTGRVSQWRVLGWLAVWAVLAIAGLGYLMRYSETPGKASEPLPLWPSAGSIRWNGKLPLLMMFIHPQCPCTRASIEELSRIVTKCRGRADFRVIIVLPSCAPPDWQQTDLYRMAAAIPSVVVEPDEHGNEACRFNMTTSGATLLFDVHRELLFAGGITGARGHAGDNLGKKAVIGWLETGHADLRSTPVLGCGLFDSGESCRSDDKPCHE